MSTTNLDLKAQLTALYAENQGWLQGWLHKKLGCSHRAADLLHDTFLRLMVRDQLIEARQPKAHLMVVAKRVLIDHWRRQQVEQAYLEALQHHPELTAPDPAEQHQLLETLLEIDQLLDGLPAPVKRAFLYAQMDGLKQAEIAEKLAISVSTVKRYLVQAGVQCYFAHQFDDLTHSQPQP